MHPRTTYVVRRSLRARSSSGDLPAPGLNGVMVMVIVMMMMHDSRVYTQHIEHAEATGTAEKSNDAQHAHTHDHEPRHERTHRKMHDNTERCIKTIALA